MSLHALSLAAHATRIYLHYKLEELYISYHFIDQQTDGALCLWGQNYKVKYKKDAKISSICLASSPSQFVFSLEADWH